MDYEEYLTRANVLSGFLPHVDLGPESLVLWYSIPKLVYLGDSGYRDPWWVVLKGYPD